MCDMQVSFRHRIPEQLEKSADIQEPQIVS